MPPEQILREPEGRNTAPGHRLGGSLDAGGGPARRSWRCCRPITGWATRRLPRGPGTGGAGGGAGGPGDDPGRRAALGGDRLRLPGAASPAREKTACRRVRRFVEKPSARERRALRGLRRLPLERRHLRLPRLDAARHRWPASSPSSPAGSRRSPPRRTACAELYAAPPRRLDRLRDHGEARRHRHPPARLRLERSRLLGGARRGAAAATPRGTPAAATPWRSTPAATSCSPTRARSPCWGSRTWSSCAPATPCW